MIQRTGRWRARPRRGTVVAMTVLLGRHDAFAYHDTGRHHPERADRLDAVLAGIAASGVADALVTFEPRLATRDEVTRGRTRLPTSTLSGTSAPRVAA